MWKLLQGCHALRNEMAHLCSQLQAYLMFEVLERAWLDLTHSLKSVTHLDDLIGKAECSVECPSAWGPATGFAHGMCWLYSMFDHPRLG